MKQISPHGLAAREELLEARTHTHRRTQNEYERPSRALHTATWETARAIPLDDPRDFDERPLTWMGVRGALYAEPANWFYPPGAWVETWGELVPEPFNEHDHHALAVDLDGARLGYASSGYAYHAHARIAAINNTGSQVLVPLRYRCDYDQRSQLLVASAFAALPTFGELDKLLPSDDEYALLFTPLWNALDDAVRKRIARDGFHLTEVTLSSLIALRHLVPQAGLPSSVRLSAVPPGVQRFLATQRRRHRAAEAARIRQRNKLIIADFHEGWKQIDIARHRSVSSTTVSKVLREAGVNTRVPRDDSKKRRVRDEIVSLLQGGRSRREVIEALGVSARAVTIAADEAGLDLPSDAGLNDYSRGKMRERLELCRRAVQLQSEGLLREEISQQLGVSIHMVKAYLTDGRFFTNPASNADRLDLARRARASGMPASQAMSNRERRALRDANMLDLIGETWRR